MSGTRRTPIGRPGTPQITPRALELFIAAERARRSRRSAGCTVDMFGFCKMECGPCKAWWKAQSALCTELKLPPWIWPCIPCCPFPPGSMKAREWSPTDEELAWWQPLERARLTAVAASAGAPVRPLSGKPDIEPTSPNDRV